MRFPGIDAAIDAAKGYLASQARDGFREAVHEMTFPRRAGFRVLRERQVSDVFARAVVARVLLDACGLDDDPVFEALLKRAARELAEHAASSKLGDRAGGWSYFPELPELPPDLDSLAAVLRLFARAAPEQRVLCEEPVALALARVAPDGAIGTWLISENDPPRSRRSMERGVRRHWGDGADVDVCAHFYLALAEAFPRRHGEEVSRGARWVASRQRPGGLWEGSWYHGDAFTAGICLELFRATGEAGATGQRASIALRDSRRADGGWGVWEPDPLETALALEATWRANEPVPGEVWEPAIRLVIDFQTRGGFWKASPWIRMNAGRARGRAGPILTYGSAVVTTAFCFRALLRARRASREEGESHERAPETRSHRSRTPSSDAHRAT